MREILDDIDRWRAAGHAGGAGPGRRRRGLGPARARRGDGRQRATARSPAASAAAASRAPSSPRRWRPRRRGRAAASSRSATATTTRSPSGSRAAARSACSSSRSTGERVHVDLRAAARPHPRRASRWRWPPSSTARRAAPSCSSRPDAAADRHARRPPSSTASSPATRWPSWRPPGPASATTARRAQTTPEDLDDSPIMRVFVESYAPPPQMWIFGAVDFTAALAKVAKVLGYRVTVVRRPRDLRHPAPLPDGRRGRRVVADPRVRAAGQRARATRRRVHPHPRPQVRRAGGAGRACRPSVGYIGVMGSRTTHEQADGAPARGRRVDGRASPG